MLPIRIKACSESDLRMFGDLAHNIQRVLPVTQADIDAAAALGQGWVVWKVVEVSDPLDNCRGGTQLVIKENSITAGQNVRRVLIVSGPSGQVVVIGPDKSPLLLPDAVADSLQYLKAYGDCETRNLPEGYQELEYIEGNSANQYINTGIVPTSTMEYYAKCAVLDRIANSFPVFGARASNGGNDGIGAFVGSGSNTRIDSFFFTASGTEYRWQLNNVNTYGDIYEITFKNALQEVIKNGTSIGTKQYTPTSTCDKPLYVGSLNNGGTLQAGEWTYRFYRFTINGIADMRPARRLSDGVLGMYDTIRKQFYTNAGTGSFIAGAALTLPEGYTRIEYIEGHNNLQYINTGIVPTSSMSMYFKGQFVSVDESTPTQVSFFMGARDVGAISGIFFQEASMTTSLDFFQAGTRWATSHTRAVNDIVELKVKNALAEVFINGSSIGTNQFTPNETTQYPIFLNALNNIGQPFNSNVNVVNRIYRFTIDGVADFVPARRDSDGAIGMFNVLNNQFYGNAGTGTFTAGGVVAPTPTTPQDIWCNNGAIKAIRPIKYLEATGTQYIDTGLKPNNNWRMVLSYKKTSGTTGNIFGTRTAASVGAYSIAYNNSNSLLLDYGTQRDNSQSTSNYYDKIINVDFNKNVLTINSYTKTFNPETFETAYNQILFGFNNLGQVQPASATIYGCKIYDNGTLVRDFIPALDANNIPCMFDKVEGKCYYNQGTGQFIAPYLPADYEELEYIQGYSANSSDGTKKAAYIDTGIIVPSNSNFYLKIETVTAPTANSCIIAGNTGVGQYTGQALYVTPTAVLVDWCGNTAGDRWEINNTLSAGDVYELSGANNTLTVVKNKTNIGSNTFTEKTTPSLSFYLNTQHRNDGTISTQADPAIIRIYRFTIAGVCDMIPARKRSNGHIGMYDLVRRQFFTNAGTGKFIAPYLPAEYERLEYIQGYTGNSSVDPDIKAAYIDTGIVFDTTVNMYYKGGIGVFNNNSVLAFGARPSNAYSGISSYFSGVDVVTDWGGTDASGRWTLPLTLIAGDTFEVSTYNKTMTISKNGTVAGTHTFTGTQTNGLTFYLNSRHDTGGAPSQSSPSIGRIYRFTVASVCDMIPVRRISDGTLGVYDFVRKQFFASAGTGTFTAGPAIPVTPVVIPWMVDGTVEKVGTRSADNKNLFNGVFEQGGIYQGSLVVADTRIRTPDYLTFPAGTYTISCASAYEVWIEKNNASSVNWYSSYTFTAASTDKFKIAVRSKTDPATTVIRPDAPVKVQIEAGSTATAYVPYCDGGVAVCENLLGIGSTQDIQEILTGEVTRNVGVFVLTGEEWWEKLNFAGKSVFRAKDVIPDDRYSNPENNIGLCSHFTVIPTSAGVTSAMNNLELAWNTNSLMCIRYDSMSTLNDFLAFLRSQYDAGTPVTIVYPLATASTESVAGQTLTISAGNNTAEIIQASIDDLLIEAKYTKSV